MAQPRTPAAHWSESPLARIFGPIQSFASQAEAGGIVLLVATLLALGLANSPLAEGYQALLETHIGINLGPWALEESLLHWVNDGLMAIFFFVVGLEIKRELLVGELANPRAAALPIIAATGGALLPAAIFALLNAGGPGAPGWGVPMATDIAFALGCMALLGSRIPFGLKIFVMAVAIVDDLIAVLVIAVFYTAQLNVVALGVGLLVLVLLAGCNWLGLRSPLVYSVLGLIVWLAFLQSGVHATIAGVLIALTIPARYRIDGPTFHERATTLIESFEPQPDEARMLTDDGQQHAVLALEDLCEQVQAPLQKLEHRLQGWVTWVIMPVFALANAGVALGSVQIGGEALPMVLGVGFGLLLGKPIGLLVASWLAVRSKIAQLPQGVSWGAMAGAGVLAGIGFTMSIFIATLAFDSADALATVKLAVLGSSL
ncbi:MAG: Na+/H+ antiporter NhaA, partial [Oscillochloris sp.]|nr:Na+/H+ antiporter NhaA [Oscillochloris sp.]